MPTPEARLATILDHATAADPCGVLLYFHTPAEAEAFLADYTRFAAQRGADTPNRRRPDDPPIVLSDASGCAESPPQTGGGDAGERAREDAVERLVDHIGRQNVGRKTRELIENVRRDSHREGAEAMRAFADQLEKIAFSMRPPNAYTPQLAMLVNALRAYAIPGKTDAG